MNDKSHEGTLDPRYLQACVDRARATTEVVIAECQTRVAARMQDQLNEARATAKQFRELAAEHENIREIAAGRDIVDIVDEAHLPLFAVLWERLAPVVDRLVTHFEGFKCEHKVLIEPELEQRLKDLSDWTSAQAKVLREALVEYELMLRENLRASKDELDELAQEWSAVDGDGLDEAS